MAAMSGDSAMCEAFKEGRDIHTETASRVYGIPRDQVERRHAAPRPRR